MHSFVMSQYDLPASSNTLYNAQLSHFRVTPASMGFSFELDSLAVCNMIQCACVACCNLEMHYGVCTTSGLSLLQVFTSCQVTLSATALAQNRQHPTVDLGLVQSSI